jgi:pyruvate dehydrogenase E2 component (dihydrolipoamide acetyltransferase)
LAKGEVELIEPTPAERTVGRRAAESRATVPHLELGVDVEMTAARGVARAEGVSMTAVLIRAVAIALRDHPRANAAYRDGHYELYSSVNIAVMLGKATPTLFDADTKTVTALEDELRELSARAERGELRPPDLSGATFTLADLGPAGIDHPSILITPPQAGAAAAGAIRAVAIVRDGAIVQGEIMRFVLASDLRILSGEQATTFLGRVKQLLEVGSVCDRNP